MSKPFAFPPPPPPPPKPIQQADTYPRGTSRGGHQGRGGFQPNQQRSRGRGQYPSRGSQRVGYGHSSRGNSFSGQRDGQFSNNQNVSAQPSLSNACSSYHSPSTGRGQKRDYGAAFSNHAQPVQRSSRPLAPPAVPTFGIDLNSLLSKKPEMPASPAVKNARKGNSLGLTPASRGDMSDEEDDEGEESKLADSITSNSLLQFEYKGQKATLNTPEEIAAWIAERRKKWPTEKKREVAQKEAEERKSKWEAEKAARQELGKAAYLARQEERQKQKVEKEKSQIRQKLIKEQIHKAKTAGSTDGQQTAAQQKAERLRRKAEKIAQRLKIAEAALDKPEEELSAEDDLDALLAQVDKEAAGQLPAAGKSDALDSVGLDSDASLADSDAIMNDDTSTSGSSSESDYESEGPPEEASSKRIGPERVQPRSQKAVPGTSTTNDTRPICKNYSQTGRCKFGRKCHFKHERPGKKEESTIGNRRKGLYQIMVEKEQEEERKKALQAIIALGDAGLLDSSIDAGKNI